MEKATINDCRAIKETGRAILVDVDGDEEWFPKATIHDDSEVYAAETEGDLVLKAWFAKKEGHELD